MTAISKNLYTDYRMRSLLLVISSVTQSEITVMRIYELEYLLLKFCSQTLHLKLKEKHTTAVNGEKEACDRPNWLER